MAKKCERCEFCGGPVTLFHQCDEKRLRRIEYRRRAVAKDREPAAPSYGERLADGFCATKLNY